MLRVRTVNGDGSAPAEDTFSLVPRHPVHGDLEDVVLTCRVVGKPEQRAIRARFEQRIPDPQTQRVVATVPPEDEPDVMLATLVAAIVSWDGIVGADDQPLAVTAETVAALPDWLHLQVATAAVDAEVVDRASFRQPRDVLPVVAATGT